MKTAGPFRIVLVTAPNLRVARKLARLALAERAAACANLIPGVESHYWWKRKLEKGREVMVIFKTRSSQVEKLEKIIIDNHPYDTPEFVAFPLSGGNARYLDWLTQSTMSQD